MPVYWAKKNIHRSEETEAELATVKQDDKVPTVGVRMREGRFLRARDVDRKLIQDRSSNMVYSGADVEALYPSLLGIIDEMVAKFLSFLLYLFLILALKRLTPSFSGLITCTTAPRMSV